MFGGRRTGAAALSVSDPLRVAIVGTGPSALTLAYFLKSLGLESVHLFEARDEVGGQSRTHDIDGFPVEMGTVYLTRSYILAKQIAREVGCAAKILPPATVLNEAGESIEPSPPSDARELLQSPSLSSK